MKVNITIPDELYETFVKKYGVPKCFSRMRQILNEMKDVPDGERYIILSGDDRRAIEAIFDKPVQDSKELAKLVKRLNAVNVHGQVMDFTVDELERIDTQAQFHGKTREDFIQWMIRDLKDMMLDKV